MTNGHSFAELSDGIPPILRTWAGEAWDEIALAGVDSADVDATLLAAWRRRAKRGVVASLDYARGREELADVFAELATWPELARRGVGDFGAGGRAFLHFHHYEVGRHADVKEGLGWGEPIPFPLGRPPKSLTTAFYAEVRRRLSLTLDAIAAAKRDKNARRRTTRPTG